MVRPSSGSIRVLIVDDEPDYADMTARHLSSRVERINAKTATAADDALDELHEKTFDCVVSDYDLPGQNGIELLEDVHEVYPDLPFILNTGKNTEDVASRAISAGVTDYFRKESGSGQYDVLANRIINSVDNYRAQNELHRQNRSFDTFLDVINDTTLTFDEQVTEVLKLGIEFLDLELGILSQIDPPDYVVEHVQTSDGSIEQGDVLDFRDTFCSLVYESNGPVAFHNPSEGEVKDHPAYQDLGLEAYLGKPLIVGGDRYGTLNFSSPRSRELPFTEGERAFIRTVSEWITKELNRKEREADLRQIKEEYETVFNTAQDGIFLFHVEPTNSDYEFSLQRVNPAHEGISGLSTDEDRGKTPQDLLGEGEGSEVVENYRRCVESAEPIAYEEVLEMPRGTIHWQTKLGPVIEDGEVTQIVGVARDITDQKERERELRETSRRLHLALDATNTGVWEWNMETDEVTWSDSLEQLLGIEPGDFGGTYEAHAEYLHPDDLSAVERSVEEAVENDGIFHAEFRMVRENGDQIWVEGRGELVQEDGTRRMIGTTTDITDRKESERELARRELLNPSVILQFRSQQMAQTVLEQTNSELEFSLDGVVSQSDGRQRMYGDISGTTPKEIKTGLEAIPTVEEARLLGTVGGTSRFEVTTTPESIGTIFKEFDGEFHAFIVENGIAKVVGEFSETVDPEAVTGVLRDVYPDIELASQHRIVIPSFLRGMMEDDLTERQRTVLGMAYYSGYFDQPRRSSGDELADRLEITRQAFNKHLRKAMATVFHKLFEEAVEPPG